MLLITTQQTRQESVKFRIKVKKLLLLKKELHLKQKIPLYLSRNSLYTFHTEYTFRRQTSVYFVVVYCVFCSHCQYYELYCSKETKRLALIGKGVFSFCKSKDKKQYLKGL